MSATRPTGRGPCDLLTIQEACRVLRINDREGRAWLIAQGLVRYFAGRPRVRAGDLVDAYDGNETNQTPAQPAVKPLRWADVV